MQTRRKIASLFLLLLLAAPLFYLSLLQARQVCIRHEMEERMEARLLQTFFIPQQELQRINSREILVHDKLFDVKKAQAVKNGIVVTGVFDEAETAVLHQIDKTCRQQATKDTPVFAQFFHLLQGFFFQESSLANLVAASNNKFFQNPISLLPVMYKQVLSPPPQSVA